MADSQHLPLDPRSSFTQTVMPPYLVAGDTVGITSPAGTISLEEIQPMVDVLKSWGCKVQIGSSIGKIWGTFGGTDQERISDLQTMLDNDAIGAIFCARGGYGVGRIIDQLDFTGMQRHPKWLVGFSDITVLHSHIHKNLGLATLHSKMASGFGTESDQSGGPAFAANYASMMSIKNALTGQAVKYPLAANVYNRLGSGAGKLVGGNLRTLETLTGTRSEFDTDNKILLVEDTDEPLYSIDRMFWHLKRTGKLSRLAGLLVGGFNITPDAGNDLPFEPDFYQIVLEKVREYNYPVCFDFPVGHQELNLAIKLGVSHQLLVGDGVPQFYELV